MDGTKNSCGSVGSKCRAALIVLLAGLCAPAGAELTAARTLPLDARSAETFADAVVGRAIAKGPTPGAVIAIVKDGRPVLVKGYGVASKSDRRPVDPDRTLFRLASTSKLLTVIAVMRQVDAGTLRLDGDVRTYVPGLSFNDRISGPTTIRHLLSHRGNFAGFDLNTQVLGADSTRAQRRASVEELNRLLRRAAPSGALPQQYDSISIGLAFYAAGAVSGLDADAAAEQLVRRPLGLWNTVNAVPRARLADLASCHASSEGGRVLQCNPPVYRDLMAGAGGFSSSGADMARLMLFMLGRGELDGRRIVSEGTFAQFANVNAHRVHPCIQGLGFGIREDVNAAGLKASSPTNIIDAPDRPGIGHNGEGVGGKAHLAVFPHANMGIFIASNLSLAELPGVTTSASSTVESARFLIPQEDGVEAARDLERAAVLGFRGTVRARGGAFLPLGCPTTVGTRPKRARWQLPGDRLSSLASPLSGPLLSRGLRRNDSRRE